MNLSTRIKSVLPLLIICINLTNVIAQDKLAEDILHQLSNTAKEYTSISIDFDYMFNNKGARINEKSSGTIDLEGDNFRIDMPTQLIINNGSTHWIYLKDLNEVTIIDYDSEDEDILSPRKLFNIYNEDYRNVYIKESVENGERMHVIDLLPKESGPIMKVRLTINALKRQFQILELYDKQGGVYTYRIKNLKKNVKVPSFIFNITKYPDVEVIDLR